MIGASHFPWGCHCPASPMSRQRLLMSAASILTDVLRSFKTMIKAVIGGFRMHLPIIAVLLLTEVLLQSRPLL
jgi:hypothetical protein